MISIRKIKTIKEVNALADLMQEIWDLDDREVVPIFEMKAVSSFGTVIGAFLTSDKTKPVGYIYAFPKFPNRHYSHMMGVHPKYQSKKIGFQLKKVHREIALDQKNPSIEAIEWTVDPLLPNNAFLNFRKLGVICNVYYDDYYGIADEVGIYPSLPTDRLLVEWFLNSKRVCQRFDSEKTLTAPFNSTEEFLNIIKPITDSTFENNILKCPNIFDIDKLKPEEINVSVEVPAQFLLDTNTSKKWAKDWRLYFRKLCHTFFQKKFFLVDYFSFIDDNTRRNFYVFTKDLKSYEY
ncbi:MAG: GNAT family N-acetyltransferase [Candidatus Hodarchaeales archaeon]|jgi:predicted GNAT superfamily acetyltransferase